MCAELGIKVQDTRTSGYFMHLTMKWKKNERNIFKSLNIRTIMRMAKLELKS